MTHDTCSLEILLKQTGSGKISRNEDSDIRKLVEIMKDKELFDLWENKIKIEISKEIDSEKLTLWKFFHDVGHKAVSRFIRKKCKISSNDNILEIGCGFCHFTKFLDKPLLDNYIGMDLSKKVLDISAPGIKRIQGDIYNLPFADGTFKYIVSIYNFEHLHYLDKALAEITRIMHDDGILIFAIPMEDGCLYNLGRNLTSRRYIEKKYSVNYMKIIREYEHPNTASKIINEVRKKFTLTDNLYLPFLIPAIDINLLAVYRSTKKSN